MRVKGLQKYNVYFTHTSPLLVLFHSQTHFLHLLFLQNSTKLKRKVSNTGRKNQLDSIFVVSANMLLDSKTIRKQRIGGKQGKNNWIRIGFKGIMVPFFSFEDALGT